MTSALHGRSFLTLRDFSTEEIEALLACAAEVKAERARREFPERLAHRNLALIFLKPSCRTRSSFAIAAADEGANLEVLSPEEIRFGKKESVRDIARVLGRLFDGIVFRGYEHELLVELSRAAGVPVWNALCNTYHPTQVLADFLTLREVCGRIRGARVCYVGDGFNNLATSLMHGAAKMGVDLRVLAPPAMQPDAAWVQSLGGQITVGDDARALLDGCDAVYSDIWISMGEEHLMAERAALLAGYKVTPELMALTGRSDTIYMHCLPALHDLSTEFAREHPELREVEDEVFESAQSHVFQQAENRMHTAKAVMLLTLTRG